MLKFTRRLLAASRYVNGRRHQRMLRRRFGACEALETRTLLAADMGTGDNDPMLEHHSELDSEGEGELSDPDRGHRGTISTALVERGG